MNMDHIPLLFFPDFSTQCLTEAQARGRHQDGHRAVVMTPCCCHDTHPVTSVMII